GIAGLAGKYKHVWTVGERLRPAPSRRVDACVIATAKDLQVLCSNRQAKEDLYLPFLLIFNRIIWLFWNQILFSKNANHKQ
ncbi:MAG: hypothetical protein ACKO96_41385, partial [Flammeovirgaceae bacterium]